MKNSLIYPKFFILTSENFYELKLWEIKDTHKNSVSTNFQMSIINISSKNTILKIHYFTQNLAQ